MIVDPVGIIPIEQGGTGGTNKSEAMISLGISEKENKIFTAADITDLVNQSQTYVDERITTKVPYTCQTSWSGKGHGVTTTWSQNTSAKLMMFYHPMGGVRFYENVSGAWSEACVGMGETLYQNTSGNTGTVTLSESADRFRMIEIFTDVGSVRVYSPNGKNAELWKMHTNEDDSTYASIEWYTKKILISGTLITVVNNGTGSAWWKNDGHSYNIYRDNNQIPIYRVIGWR